MKALVKPTISYPLPIDDGPRPPLPPARTRACWPTRCDIGDDHGRLGRIHTWPYELRPSDRFRCSAVCAACGYARQAAGAVRYAYWGHTPIGFREIKEYVTLHLCIDCVLSARAGGPEAALIRERLSVISRYCAANAWAERKALAAEGAP